jgi:hypothetical protein
LEHSRGKGGKLHCGGLVGFAPANPRARPAIAPGEAHAGRYTDALFSRYVTSMRAPTILMLIVAVMAGGCTRTPDEQRIRENMAVMQQALEMHQPKALMAHISEDFIGNDAEFGRDDLANFLRIEVLRNDQIGILLGPIDVEIDGGRATAKVTATFTGGGPGGLLPEHGSIYSITSSWKRSGRDWICYSARWQQEL